MAGGRPSFSLAFPFRFRFLIPIGVKIIVLRAGDAAAPVAARRGEFFSWIRREGGTAWEGEWAEHDVRDLSVPLPSPKDAAAFVITGSSSSVTERAPWML